MSEEIDSLKSASASEPAAPAPAPEVAPLSTEVVPDEAEPAVSAESAPAAEPNAGQEPEPEAEPAKTGTEGAEPAEEPKVKLSELLATRKRAQAAEQRAAFLEGRLEEIKPQAEPKPAAQTALPKFTPLEEFSGTFDEWVAAKTKFEIRQEQEQEQRVTQANATRKQWDERCQKAAVEIPDLEETLNNPVQPFPHLPNLVAAAITKSDLGPQMVYYLHKNPAEGIRLAQMEPELAVMELAGIREKAKTSLQPKTKKVTTAPPPINPGNAAGTSTTTDLADKPMDEYAKDRNSEMFVKVGGHLVRRR